MPKRRRAPLGEAAVSFPLLFTTRTILGEGEPNRRFDLMEPRIAGSGILAELVSRGQLRRFPAPLKTYYETDLAR